MDEIRKILDAAQPPDQRVSSELLPLVYQELKDIAARYMLKEAPGQTLQATALVHEAWLRLSKNDSILWNGRVHFFNAASQAMRQILVSRARAKDALKRGGRRERLDIHEMDFIDLTQTPIDDRVILIDEVLREFEKEDAESARIISLKFFGGLTNKEIASMLGVAERTIERRWAYARLKLLRRLVNGQ